MPFLQQSQKRWGFFSPFSDYSVYLCESSVALCVKKKLRTYTEEHREAQRYTENTFDLHFIFKRQPAKRFIDPDGCKNNSKRHDSTESKGLLSLLLLFEDNFNSPVRDKPYQGNKYINASGNPTTYPA